jgi:N-acetylneuraminate synthase
MSYISNESVYIIAEAGVNHNGQRELAFSLVNEAASCGANAIKFQTFDANKLASRSAPKAAYQKETTAASETQLSMLRKLELPQEWHSELQYYARSRDIDFISTAFDVSSLQFLVNLDVPLLKLPSGELTNSPLVWHFARTGKPLIVSTGMATLSEVEEALAVICHGVQNETEPCGMGEVWKIWSRPQCRRALSGRVTLLHCTSQYPTSLREVNLRAMDTLATCFGLPVGYSDHTQGIEIAVAAVARGAKIIEKHFTLDKSLPGPDHQASLEPSEFKQMTQSIRGVEQALGDGAKYPQESEWDTRTAARQQIILARNVRAGQIIVREDLTTARTGQGLPPARLWELVGKVAIHDYEAGETYS